ncbi:MAG: hypothetical protein K940chlam3_00345 [Chlamydiae bacterium]|nr:hypothetical protein [Chlamydiota bacterium]
MDTDAFKIYIDRLWNGKKQVVDESFSPNFLGVDEEGLKFQKPVNVAGEAYIAENELVLHFSVKAEASMPCAICNEWTSVSISLDSFYEVISLEEVKGAIFDFSENLREEILLHIPHTVECHGGSCPARKDVNEYIREDSPDEIEGYQPFADL